MRLPLGTLSGLLQICLVVSDPLVFWLELAHVFFTTGIQVKGANKVEC